MRLFSSKILIISFLSICFSASFFCQESGFELSDKKFRLEIEPATFFLNGAAASLSYAVDEKKNFNLGVYLLSCDVPNFSKEGVFVNVQDDTEVRIGFEFAVTGKYKLNLFKNKESNPFVGFILGWEYFDIKQPYDSESFRISTWIFTPYLGHEIYLYKQMVYLHPQLRGVLYFGSKHEFPSRPEQLSSSYLLPQIGLGVRL